jgi:hypothetical protein
VDNNGKYIDEEWDICSPGCPLFKGDNGTSVDKGKQNKKLIVG